MKAKVTNTKRSREDRLKAQQDVKVKLKKLREGASIEETEEALSKHVNNISKQVRSHLQQDEIRSAFCTWEEKDVPEINENQRGNVEELKKIYDECVEQRLEEFLQNLEKRDRLVAKAHDDLAERFCRGFFEFENDIREIDLVLVGETTDEVLLKTGVNPNKLLPPFDPRVRKFLFLTSIIFMPVLFPVGFAAGVLSAPVIGYLAVDKILTERHLRGDSCRVLTELSEDFLQKFIEKGISNRVSKEFTEEEERISRIKRCYEGLVEKYEKRCKDLTTSEDEGKVKEILETLSPLYAQLEEMSQKLTFDAIQHGIRVMSPSCIIDKKTLCYMETSRDKLGGGSFGEVYKGEIILPGCQIKEVAVKKLKDIPRAPNVASFLREADILM